MGGVWRRDPVQFVQCKCPKCERIYERGMFWTGEVMPRIYCDSCKGKAYRLDNGAIAVHSTPLTNLASA